MNARTSFLIEEDARRIVETLITCPYARPRCVSAVAKRVILRGPYAGGKVDIKAKSLGAGVFEMYREFSNQ